MQMHRCCRWDGIVANLFRPRLSPQPVGAKFLSSRRKSIRSIASTQRKGALLVGGDLTSLSILLRGGSGSASGPGRHLNGSCTWEGTFNPKRLFSQCSPAPGRGLRVLQINAAGRQQPCQFTRLFSSKPRVRNSVSHVMNQQQAYSNSPAPAAGSSSTGEAQSPCRAFIGLGSNMGDCIAMIEQACREMEARGLKIIRTSSLFETAPMYVTDQEKFINGVCEIETTMGPIALLDTLQSIEKDMGRRKIIDKGPRNIDLDILLYNDLRFSHPRLEIPHKFMLEREFVLRPLCQLIPNEHPPLSDKALSFRSYLDSLPPSNPPPIAVTPLFPHLPPLTPSDPKRATIIMAVLNVTPDSFADGGKHSPENIPALTETILNFIKNGATIIDVGGESTRPGCPPVTKEVELSRVIPTIRLIRSLPEANKIAVSIDTYRASVAEAAVEAGADIINDISGATMDPNMLATMAKLQKTVILQHMRGTPQTMTKLTDYSAYADGPGGGSGIISGIANELTKRVGEAEKVGMRRWRIILDPGIGFAKIQPQNLEILRNGHILRGAFEELSYFPWLVGTSLKGFIGNITGIQTPSERLWGTAAGVTASIGGGADIVRVHNVNEMRQVVKMADAIYRDRVD
ncbi:dihydropteroate synthase [Paracoccidioides brasiliensis]|uniref:Folic acid synthesis protein FOL1 n=1 Tax=Paracoccidioides brasiliensis TaxID=121759 RepID=A0A1D2J4F5_PARBR|nr:dihydropteroate synthase [Paracoccidioides brasiliensis]